MAARTTGIDRNEEITSLSTYVLREYRPQIGRLCWNIGLLTDLAEAISTRCKHCTVAAKTVSSSFLTLSHYSVYLVHLSVSVITDVGRYIGTTHPN